MSKFLDGVKDATKNINGKIGSANFAIDLLSGDIGRRPKQIIRGSNRAELIHELKNPYYTSTQPLLSFQYYIRINLNNALSEYINEYFGDKMPKKFNSYISSATLPSFNVDTSILREENRRRIIQKSIQPEAVNIEFIDVNNSMTMLLWQMYYNYYFKDANKDFKNQYMIDSWTRPSNSNREFGYNLREVKDTRQLIKNIEIFQVYAGKYRKTTLHNPTIINFNQNQMSYETQDLMKISYGFEYEWADFSFHDIDDEQLIAADQDMKQFFDQVTVLEYSQWLPTTSVVNKKSTTIDDVIETAKTIKETVDNAKDLARKVASKVSKISSIANQIQMDITGKDEPIVEFPDGRKLAAQADKIPTSWGDVKRIRRGSR